MPIHRAQKRLGVLLITGGLVMGMSLPALAQDSPEVVMGYQSQDGLQAGTITIREIEPDFRGYAPDDPPGPGQRYFALLVRFEAAEDRPFEAEPSGIRLEDLGGFVYGPTSIALAGATPTRLIEDGRLQPGDRINGLVGFEVPQDAVIDAVLYSPTVTRDPIMTYRPKTGAKLVTIADGEPMEAPPMGTAVSDANPDGSQSGTVTVRGLTDPYTPYVPVVSPPIGEVASPPADASPLGELRYVLVDVVFEAAPNRGFQSAPWFIILHDTEGNQWGFQEEMEFAPDVIVGELANRDLGPEDRTSGVVGFVVPKSAVIDAVMYEPPYGDRHIPLAAVQPAE